MENEPSLCPACHEPVLPTYYFCPNCGKNLREPPLSTSVSAQIGIYLLSIIMPAILFLAITHWSGVKYLKSQDPRARQIGIVAIILMTASTIALVWWGIVWYQQFMQSVAGGLFGGTGNLGF